MGIDIKLNKKIKPINYNIKIEPKSGFRFEGSEIINCYAEGSVKEVVLNAKELEFKNASKEDLWDSLEDAAKLTCMLKFPDTGFPNLNATISLFLSLDIETPILTYSSFSIYAFLISSSFAFSTTSFTLPSA